MPHHLPIAVIGASGMLARALRFVAPDAVGWASSRVDVRRPETVREALLKDKPRAVINCAAWTDVDGAETQHEEALAVNGTGAGNVAVACAEAGVRLIHVSTDYVFDGAKVGEYEESDLPAPLGVYGHTKLVGERAVQDAGGNWLVARTAWLYGPWSRRNFVDTMLRLTAERPQVDAVADAFGSPTLSVDLAWALLFLASVEMRGIVHVVNQGRTSWHGLATEIARVSHRSCKVNAVPQEAFPRPAKRPRNSVLSTETLRSAGFVMRPWQEALAEYVGKATSGGWGA